ncbi:hypothetical protein WJX72_010588 [[Myrmecia] bisecta]|uniref:BZIP domain-containing protein n=1 Tax=[Myrmecia] bisecta TaxID=41462 RepID=A0AAW1P9H1_9CHLO
MSLSAACVSAAVLAWLLYCTHSKELAKVWRSNLLWAPWCTARCTATAHAEVGWNARGRCESGLPSTEIRRNGVRPSQTRCKLQGHMAGHLVPSEAHLQAACYAKSGFDFAHLTELANQALGSTYDSARSSAFTHSGFDAPGGGCSSQPTQAGWQSAEGSQDEELSGASPGESEANPNAEPRRLKVMHAKVLSAKEKAERRKEGNRIAAQRLRKKRVETKNALVEEVTRLQAEQARYKAHMAHMASGCQSVVMENHELRRELEALRASAACQMKDPNFANPLPLFGSLSAHHAAELNNLGPLQILCMSKGEPEIGLPQGVAFRNGRRCC